MNSECKWHKDGSLPSNGEIFVFGSNLAGRHGAGAAKVAMDMFGAKYGVALGRQGKSYAIATLDESFQKVSINFIEQQVSLLRREWDDSYVDNGVFITRIGCGLAGFNEEEIAPMFEWCIKYGFFSLPEPWKKYYETT